MRSLDDEARLAQRGTVNNWSLTARGIVFIIAGHFQHHMKMLRERYSIDVTRDESQDRELTKARTRTRSESWLVLQECSS